MKDTIEWLETIGTNADLRHAPGEALARMLGTDASDALVAAARAQDGALLVAELGHRPMKVNHDVHTGGHEEHPPGHERDPDEQPSDPDEPSRPDHHAPSHDH